jgi:glycosyltransferase involved in cell wall biosynthesis
MIAGKKILGALAGDFSHGSHREMFDCVSDKVINLGSPPSSGGPENVMSRVAHLLKNLRRKEFSDYDIILAESPILQPNVYKRLFGARFRIVSLFASPGIYKIFGGKVNPLAAPVLKSVVKQSDGFVPVSKMCADYLIGHGIERPMEVAYPYVEPGKYKTLQKNSYDAESRYLVTVGYPTEYKGIDFALKVFDALAEKDGNLELRVITKSLDAKYLAGLRHASRIKLMSNIGNEDFCKTLGGAAACLHFGRFDTFPVSTLEAMLSGVPTFTSVLTGTKEVAVKAGKEFVLEFDIEKSAESIGRFLALSAEEKAKLSATFRESALPFGKEERLADFREKFARLVERL